LSRIETLNTLINAAEEDMVHLKQSYERAVKDRNSVGIHLLDRNDELCILYERLNIQAGVMKKGEAELKEREEDLRQLKIVTTELERRLELKKKKKPEMVDVRAKLVGVQEELNRCRARVAELSAKMESPEDPERCRDLGGEDPEQKDLLEKIRRLELMLAEKEERLLEKDLLLEEVSTLTDRLKKQTMEGRQESHEVSARLNDLSKKIKNATRGIMARVSELSMYQALAMGLYQEKCEKVRKAFAFQ
jgi:chromosome segregation ATPase